MKRGLKDLELAADLTARKDEILKEALLRAGNFSTLSRRLSIRHNTVAHWYKPTEPCFSYLKKLDEYVKSPKHGGIALAEKIDPNTCPVCSFENGQHQKDCPCKR